MFAVRGRPRFASLAVFALVLFGRAAPRSRPSHRAVRLACFRKNGSQAHTHGNALFRLMRFHSQKILANSFPHRRKRQTLGAHTRTHNTRFVGREGLLFRAKRRQEFEKR
uniref:Putative secreted protein n=1 Tax=Anopheles darlingi TaxID=43151 RepID=A0A2M4DDX4_ANODA